MIYQKVVQNARAHHHLENLIQVLFALNNPTVPLQTLKTSFQQPQTVLALNPHFRQLSIKVALIISKFGIAALFECMGQN